MGSEGARAPVSWDTPHFVDCPRHSQPQAVGTGMTGILRCPSPCCGLPCAPQHTQCGHPGHPPLPGRGLQRVERKTSQTLSQPTWLQKAPGGPC